MRIKGQRLVRKRYRVQPTGGSRSVVLTPDFRADVGDTVRQYILPDGSLRIVREPAVELARPAE